MSAILLTGAVGACSSEAPPGPLSAYGMEGTSCLPDVGEGASWTVGGVLLTFDTEDTVTLLGGGFLEDSNLIVEEVLVAPIDSTNLFGFLPATEDVLAAYERDGAEPVPGASPLDSGAEYKLALIVRRADMAAEGHGEGIYVEYETDKGKFRAVAESDAVTLIDSTCEV